MKLMLDIHGVLDSNPELFVSIATLLRSSSFENEVHIVTGESITPKLIDQLKGYNNGVEFWDHLVSIQDELLKGEVSTLGIDSFGRPRFPDDIWDSFKGKYCAQHDIDLAIDDTEAYRKYFDTPFLLYTHKGA